MNKKMIIRAVSIVAALIILITCVILSGIDKRNVSSKYAPLKEYVSEILDEEDSNFDGAFELAIKTSARVERGDVFGSGNIYAITENEVILVTAYHVLSESEDPIKVTFWNYKEYDAEIFGVDEALDIAFLRSEPEINSLFKSVYIDGIAPAIGEEVLVIDPYINKASIGFVENPKVFVESFNMDMIKCMCVGNPGMSGSGLFNERGIFLGIVIAGGDDGSIVCADVNAINKVYENVVKK